ncbi:MAG: amino acid permease [Myxococcota bacterium]|nr:amino acid permease [Myxococcota bacterium]
MSENDQVADPNGDTGAKLARELGLGAALSIGIGTMICAGIFVLPGIAAAKAGPIVVFAFGLCGLVAVLIALCMSELSTGMPQAGGGYLFIVRAFGPMLGSVMGWCLWLSLIFASAFYMIGFGYYISDVLPISHVWLALFMTALLTGLNFIGAKEAGGTQNVIVAGLLIALVVFFVRAIFEVDMDKVTPWIPPEIGIQGFLVVTPVLFVTFMGFAEIAAVSEEIKNPDRNLPLAVVGSVVIVTVVYCAVEFCVVGLLEYNDPAMAEETVLMELARQLMGKTGYTIILLGGILATVSSANASIMAASRISFAMGRDRLMPDWFNQIHGRFRTPYRSIFVTGGLTMVLLVVLGTHLELIAEVGAFLSLLLYAFISLACMVMRHVKLEWYKPSFKTPLYPVVPIIGLLGCVFVMSLTSRPTIMIGMGIVAGALIWYVLFLRKRTTLTGASNILFKQKVIMSLAAKAEEYVAARKDAFPVILVPLANPETQGSLLKVGTALAKASKARLHLAHVVSVPVQTPLEAGRIAFEQTRREQETLLDVATRQASKQGIRARANTLVAHDVPSALLNVADLEQPELILLGWRGEVRGANVTGVVKAADRNVLVLKDNGLNKVRRILVLVGRGPHTKLGLKVAQQLSEQWGAAITAMTVQVGQGYAEAKSEFDQESLQLFQGFAEEFVRDTLKDTGVAADVSVVIATDVGQAIVDAADEHDLIIIGASEEWAVKQWLFGSLPDKVANNAAGSVLMVRSGN